MRTWKNDDYELRLDPDGIVEVYRTGPVPIVETMLTPDGVATRKMEPETAEESTKVLLKHFKRSPVVKVCYSGGGLWHVDLEAGFCRNIGYRSGKSVGIGLREVLGFNRPLVVKIMRAARKHEHAYMGRAC